MPRAFGGWVLCAIGAALAATAAGGQVSIAAALAPALLGFVLSFRFPQTRLAPIIDAAAVAIWVDSPPAPVLTAAALYAGFGWVADNRIFRHEISSRRKQ